MQEKLLDISKEELIKTIENMELSTIGATQGRVNHIFNMLSNLESMPEMPESKPKTPTSTPHVKPVKETEEQKLHTPEPEPEEETDTDVHRFERKLRGGMLQAIDAFVPEGTVKSLGLETGDLVRAILIEESHGSEPAKYDFELVEKTTEDNSSSEICAVEHGIVNKLDILNEYRVREHITPEGKKEIDFEDCPDLGYIVLQQRDVDQLNIKAGDIVDLAFYKNNPMTARIRWRYSHDIEEELKTPKKSGFYKDNDSGPDKEYPQTLHELTILMVGGEPWWPAYREEVENRGGTFVGRKGTDTLDSIENAVSNADCLINSINHVSHRATNAAIDAAKKHDIKYGNITTFGRSNFIRTVEELVNGTSE